MISVRPNDHCNDKCRSHSRMWFLLVNRLRSAFTQALLSGSLSSETLLVPPDPFRFNHTEQFRRHHHHHHHHYYHRVTPPPPHHPRNHYHDEDGASDNKDFMADIFSAAMHPFFNLFSFSYTQC